MINRSVIVLLFLFLASLSCPAHAVTPIALQSMVAGSSEGGHENTLVPETVESDRIDSSVTDPQTGLFTNFSMARTQVWLEGFLQVLYWRLDILVTANLAKVPYDLSSVLVFAYDYSECSGCCSLFQCALCTGHPKATIV